MGEAEILGRDVEATAALLKEATAALLKEATEAKEATEVPLKEATEVLLQETTTHTERAETSKCCFCYWPFNALGFRPYLELLTGICRFDSLQALGFCLERVFL